MLVDEDTEIADPDFCAKVRRALADPDVGLVGCAGATGVESVAWWAATVSAGPVTYRYSEYGGGEIDTFAATRAGSPPAEVETVAGYLLVLSPWAARTLRFDEELAIGVGFDLDFALRLRQAGRKVVTADLRVIRHKTLKVVEDLDVWVEGHIDLADKWDGRLPGAPPLAGRLEGARPAGRGRARRRARPRLFALLAARRPRRRRSSDGSRR